MAEHYEQFREAWVVRNPEDGETGVLLRFGQKGRRHWYLICPATATLYFEEVPIFDDCQIGMECDFLDTVHAEATRLARALCAEEAKPDTLSTLARGGLGHCCFAGCTLVNCRWCGESRCVHDFHTCAPSQDEQTYASVTEIAQSAPSEQVPS